MSDIQNLKRELASINAQLFPSNAHIAMESALIVIEKQEALIASLRKDAERYRWLRNESWAGYNSGKNKPEVFETVTMVLGSARNFNTILAEEALDDAVDAALLADTSTQEVG